jgi:hypothetical protein
MTREMAPGSTLKTLGGLASRVMSFVGRHMARGTRPRRSAVAVPKPKSMSSSDRSFIS